MNRKEILSRVNQRLDGRLYRWNEVKYDFDDAILEINDKLQTSFPMFTEVMLYDQNKYEFYYIEDPELGPVKFFNKDRFDEWIYAPNYPNINDMKKEVFPAKYIRTIVIPFVVARLLQREDEFGNLQSAIHQEAMNGIQNMYFEYYNDVPDYFIQGGGEFTYINNHSRINPFEINKTKPKLPHDPLNQEED